MKDYKLLVAGLILLLLILFIAVFTWLWSSNRKNSDPLPILVSENDITVSNENNSDDENTPSDNRLYIQAEKNLQQPLDDIIISFESRYPRVQVLANYVPAATLLTLSNSTAVNEERADFVFSTDMIMANGDLSIERLAPLQKELNAAQNKKNQALVDNNNSGSADIGSDSTDQDDTKAVKNDNQEMRTLNSFNYALKDQQALEGVILTDNTVAISFRNFLLSSAGQDILKQYDYHNIDGYQNSVNDLFNPTSRAKKATGENPVDVADALSNGK